MVRFYVIFTKITHKKANIPHTGKQVRYKYVVTNDITIPRNKVQSLWETPAFRSAHHPP